MQQADVARDGEPDKPLTRAGFCTYLALLLATLRHSPQRRALLALAALGLVIVVAATAAGQIRLNYMDEGFLLTPSPTRMGRRSAGNCCFLRP